MISGVFLFTDNMAFFHRGVEDMHCHNNKDENSY